MVQVDRVVEEPWPLPLLRSQGPELERKLKDALAAYDTAAANPAAKTVSIAPIVRAALDPHVAIHEPGAQLLAHLTANHEAARVAVTKMARQANWQFRFNALLCLGPSTPKDFAAEIVRALLADSSSRVRGKAAEQALHLGLASLTEAVGQATATESSDTAIHALELSRDLMRDGYSMKPARGGFFITVWTGSGTTGSWYSEADVAKRGLQAILNDLRGAAEPG
jgi:hypothetical protein